MTETVHGTADLALVHFEGANAARFLQGYLTCNTSTLAGAGWVPGAFCDLKGRVVASGWVRAVDSGIDCVVHAGIAARLLEFLGIYLRLGRTRATIDDTTQFDVSFDDHGAHPVSITKHQSGLRPDAPRTSLIDVLNRRRFVLVTSPASGQFLPQALGLVDLGAVAFDKGCYLGQEIVARVEHRGSVKRHLLRVVAAEPLVSSTIAALTNENRQKIGEVVQIGSFDALVVASAGSAADTAAGGTACFLGETRVTAEAD